jgi:AcrR family transcriptional regulator
MGTRRALIAAGVCSIAPVFPDGNAAGATVTTSSRSRVHSNHRPERKSVVTRRHILAAGRALLDETSITDLTVDDIVREAGVAVGTFYLYFSDKYDMLKALLREVVERCFQEDFVQLDHRIPRYERIRIAIRSNFNAWLEHCGTMASLHRLAMVRSDFEVFFEDELRRPFSDRLEAEIRSSIERGYARPVDPRAAADIIGTMITWTFMRWIGMRRPPYAGADLDALTESMAMIWYRALYAEDPPA